MHNIVITNSAREGSKKMKFESVSDLDGTPDIPLERAHEELDNLASRIRARRLYPLRVGPFVYDDGSDVLTVGNDSFSILPAQAEDAIIASA